MTSTSINVGFDGTTRNSSKVLKPPGGGSSDIFGSAPVEQSPRRRTNYMQSSLFVEPESNTTPARVKSGDGTTTNGVKEASAVNGNDNANESANINANNENSTASAPAALAPAASTTTSSPARAATAPQRSRVPPGGFSSGLW